MQLVGTFGMLGRWLRRENACRTGFFFGRSSSPCLAPSFRSLLYTAPGSVKGSLVEVFFVFFVQILQHSTIGSWDELQLLLLLSPKRWWQILCVDYGAAVADTAAAANTT